MIKEQFDKVGIEYSSRWKDCKLGEVIEVKYGKDHKSLSDGNIPVYGSGGIMRFGDKALYDKKSILIPRKGSLNNIFYKDEPFWTVDTMFWSKIDEEKVFPKFLFYQLTTVDYSNLNVGSAVPSLTVPVIEAIDISLPPLPEQTAIATILSSLDDKIDLLHRQNKTLEQLAETLFRQWFVEEEWQGTLSEFVKVQSGYAFKSKDFREVGFAGIIKITNISMGFIDISKSDFVDETAVKNLDTKFKIKSGDFLIAMTGAEIGKIGIVEKTEKEIWLNQRVGKLEAKVPYGNIIGYLALKSREGQDHILNACSGSAQENISTTGIEEMIFAKYDEAKAISFGKEAKPLFDKIIFNLNQIRTLTQTRDTLLPKLMSGEVRVEM